MYKIELMNPDHALDIARIKIDAFPGHGLVLEEAAKHITETHERPDVKYYSAFKEDKLVGGFCIWDFDMNMRQAMVKAGGVGAVVVDLCHKKEKIALEIIRYFLDNLRSKGANMAMLYPFDSGFYHKMGFGFGTLLQQYRLKPADLPGGKSKSHITRLTEDDAQAITDFYNSRVKCTHGLITKRADEFIKRLKLPANKFYAHVEDGQVRGYIYFQFRKGSDESTLVNDMFVGELLFDSPEVFAELMAFAKSQADQIRYCIINTLEEGLINTIPDPRNHMDRMLFSVYQEVCRTGLGIMYRICDVEGFFKDISSCRFGNLNMTIQVNVNDSFIPENNKPFMLKFSDGQCKITPDATPDAELCIDIAEFTSLVIGTVNLTHLVRYGKAKLSNMSHLAAISNAFSLDEKPICLTYF